MAAIREENRMTREITSTIHGPLVLSLSDPLASGGSDDPLFISSTGTINSLGDAIVGDAGTPWVIFNQGLVQGGSGWAIDLAGAGVLYNSGVISDIGDVEIGGSGLVVNEGSISGVSYCIKINGDGVVTNQGWIGDSAMTIKIGGNGVVTNQGSILSNGDGISIGGIGSVINEGYIYGEFAVDLSAGLSAFLHFWHRRLARGPENVL
jgi:hypothetical protein